MTEYTDASEELFQPPPKNFGFPRIGRNPEGWRRDDAEAKTGRRLRDLIQAERPTAPQGWGNQAGHCHGMRGPDAPMSGAVR